MADHHDLSDAVVLLTGASGGIGAATARALYREGARLVLTDVDEVAVKQFADEFAADRVLHRTLDVTDADATARVVDEAVERFGRLDVVFANAGIGPSEPSTVATTDPAFFEKIIEVDLLGVYRTIHAALPHVVESRGQVLITASIYAFMNGAINAPYAMSKAGVEQLGRALRAELAGTGATASVLYPGWIRTPLTTVAFGGDAATTELMQRLFRGPLGRRVEPEVVADAVVRGLQRRSPRIHAPRFWAIPSMLRGPLNAASDLLLDVDTTTQQMVRRIEERARLRLDGQRRSR